MCINILVFENFLESQKQIFYLIARGAGFDDQNGIGELYEALRVHFLRMPIRQVIPYYI